MLVAHLVEFIDATGALVSQNQGTSFEGVLAAALAVFGQSHRQARTGRRVAANVNACWND